MLAGDDLTDIAAGLAAAINAGAPSDYAAVAEEGTLVIVRRDGTAFSATPRIAAAGQPKEGEEWRVTLKSATSGPLPQPHGAADAAEQTHERVALALAAAINSTGRPEFRARAEGGVLHVENIAGNVFTTGFDVDGSARADDVKAGSAIVATRVEGINYYELETLEVELGTGDDVLNVQGTTAATNVHTNAGDDGIYVSSAANFTVDPSPDALLPQFLAGHLHQVNGALAIDAGAGHNQLMLSGEASTLDNDDIVVSDVLLPGEPAGAEIAVRGLTGGDKAFGLVLSGRESFDSGSLPVSCCFGHARA